MGSHMKIFIPEITPTIWKEVITFTNNKLQVTLYKDNKPEFNG